MSDVHSVSLTLCIPLLSSLSLYPPAQPLWVSGSQWKSFILLEACHWPWYDGSGNKSIVGTSIEYLHPFTNHFWQGIHNRSRRGAVGYVWRESSPLRWNSWEQEIGRLRSTCLVSEPLPTLPRDHPCSTVLAAHWVFGKRTAYLWRSAES